MLSEKTRAKDPSVPKEEQGYRVLAKVKGRRFGSTEERKAEGVLREKLEEVCRGVRNGLSSYLVVSITNPYRISQEDASSAPPILLRGPAFLRF